MRLKSFLLITVAAAITGCGRKATTTVTPDNTAKAGTHCELMGSWTQCRTALGVEYVIRVNLKDGSAPIACFADGRIWPARTTNPVELNKEWQESAEWVKCAPEDAPGGYVSVMVGMGTGDDSLPQFTHDPNAFNSGMLEGICFTLPTFHENSPLKNALTRQCEGLNFGNHENIVCRMEPCRDDVSRVKP